MTSAEKQDVFKVMQVIAVPRLIDTRFLQTSTGKELERAIEEHFVHCSSYAGLLNRISQTMC